MAKYRIIKVPMYRLVGEDSYLGFTHAYKIQKKFMFWWIVVGCSNISLEGAREQLQRMKSRKLEGHYEVCE